LRFGRQTALYRIAVHVAKLLSVLGCGVYVEIVIASLPEWTLPSPHRHGKLQRLERFRQNRLSGFTDQKVNVFGHDYVSEDKEIVSDPYPFQGLLEEISRGCRSQVWLSAVTTERDEVEVSGLLITDEGFRHGEMLVEIRRNPHLKSEMWGTHRNVGLSKPRSQKRDLGHPKHP
jgi:hypothetical protein